MSTLQPQPNSIRRMDAGDPAVTEFFERGFYNGFEHATHNKLIQTLWIWDHEERRLRTRIPYEDQALWARYTGETFAAGVAVNVRMRMLQSAAFGFSVPPEFAPAQAEGRVCEFMALFVVEDNTLSGIFTFWKEVFAELHKEGFTHALATTAPKILPLYRRIGGVIIDEATIEDQKRFFLHFDLTRAGRWMERVTPAKTAPELFLPRHLVMPVPEPEQALPLVDRELGVQLGRLLVAMNIARGDGDEGFDLQTRHKGAAAVRQSIQQYLAHFTSDLPDPAQAALLARQKKNLLTLEALEGSVHAFAATACAQPGDLTAMLTESLDLLLLTALRAWDNEDGEREMLCQLARDDRGPLLAKLRHDALGDSPDANTEAALTNLTKHFADAVSVLHRLFVEESVG